MESSQGAFRTDGFSSLFVSRVSYIVMLTMEEALKQHSMKFAAGEIVKGTVIEVRPKEVMVDIGYKSEGVIPANEFDDIKVVKLGDLIDVLIERLEDKDGMVVLSKEKAEFKQNWEKIVSTANEGITVMGKVKAVVKGGLLVNIGVEAFLPASQVDIVPPKNLAIFVGNSYEFKIVKINQDRQNVVLSRRELIEAERNARRANLLSEMVPGDIRKGTVKNITDFGAFIDLNGLDGLLHITDMSWVASATRARWSRWARKSTWSSSTSTARRNASASA